MASDTLDSHQTAQLSGSSSPVDSPSTNNHRHHQQQQTSSSPSTSSTLFSSRFPTPSRMPDSATFEDLTTQFHTMHVSDTRFEIFKRYESLRIMGSGAQGVVWYVESYSLF